MYIGALQRLHTTTTHNLSIAFMAIKSASFYYQLCSMYEQVKWDDNEPHKEPFFSTFYIFVALHEATSQLGLLEFMETNSFVTVLVTPTPTNQMAYSFLVLALQQKKNNRHVLSSCDHLHF